MRVVFRGDVWNVDLGTPFGSEQGGVRPCVVISNDVANQYSPTIIVLPITSQSKQFQKTHVETNDLEIKPSYVLCEQIRVVDQKRFKKKIGKLSVENMSRVQNVTFGQMM